MMNDKKMNTCLLFFMTLLISYASFSQQSEDKILKQVYPGHSQGDFTLYLSPGILMKTPNGTQFAGGLKARFFFARRFSFDTDLVFSHDYCRVSPGLIGFPLLIIATSLDYGQLLERDYWEEWDPSTLPVFLLVTALVILSAEHITYHQPVLKSLDISPYLSLLRYRWAYEHGNHADPDRFNEQLCYAFGLEINKYFGKFLVTPFFEYNAGYKDHIPGYVAGIHFGISFK